VKLQTQRLIVSCAPFAMQYRALKIKNWPDNSPMMDISCFVTAYLIVTIVPLELLAAEYTIDDMTT